MAVQYRLGMYHHRLEHSLHNMDYLFEGRAEKVLAIRKYVFHYRPCKDGFPDLYSTGLLVYMCLYTLVVRQNPCANESLSYMSGVCLKHRCSRLKSYRMDRIELLDLYSPR
jgi:hypothetical protein